MRFTSERRLDDGVLEREFTLGEIPGILWTRGSAPAPLILLGDAAHLTPPNGEGANLAMQDGAELGEAIAAHPHDAEVALSEYEQAMFPRAAAAAGAEDIYDLMLGDHAPGSWIAMMSDGEQAA